MAGVNLTTVRGRRLTYRALLLWLERDAGSREDAELDMPVVVRVVDPADGDVLVGYLSEVSVGPNQDDDGDSLTIDGGFDDFDVADVRSPDGNRGCCVQCGATEGDGCACYLGDDRDEDGES